MLYSDMYCSKLFLVLGGKWILGRQEWSWETSKEAVVFVQAGGDGHLDQVVSSGGGKRQPIPKKIHQRQNHLDLVMLGVRGKG